MEDVRKVANTLISEANKNGDKIDNQRLQRFLYYVEGYCLALFDESAFQEKIAMSKHGPIVKSVYDELIPYGAKTINNATLKNKEKISSEKIQELIQEVYRSYRHMSTSQLNGMIMFVDGTPFDENLATGTGLNCNVFYSPQEMKEYFTKLLNNIDENNET